MDINKVNAYINQNEYGNPMTDEATKVIQNRINNKESEVGKLIRQLLTLAEEGKFK